MRGAEADVYYRAIAGGPETRLAIPGFQGLPRIAGNLIAFESYESESTLGNSDLFVHDIATSTTYRLTQSPSLKYLGDITSCGGVNRIVYSALNAEREFDLYAFTFTLTAAPEDDLTSLIESVRSLELQAGINNSLVVKLQQVASSLEPAIAVLQDAEANACAPLTAFVNQVKAQSGKHIPADAATPLVTQAEGIKTALGCEGDVAVP